MQKKAAVKSHQTKRMGHMHKKDSCEIPSNKESGTYVQKR